MKTKVPDIGKEFIQTVGREIKKMNIDPSILLYGSSVYGVVTHDLDIAFIVDKYTPEELKKVTDLSIDFQRQNGMELDAEVPYESKMMYSSEQVTEMIENTPFQKVNGVYRITPIEKTEEYLSSKEMKFRLLLNILTTRSLLLEGHENKIDGYKKKAWDTLMKVVVSYHKLTEVNLDNLIEKLQKDEKTGTEGEMFLGYKTNIPQKSNDLAEDCEETIDRLTKTGKMKKVSSRIYIPTDNWDR